VHDQASDPSHQKQYDDDDQHQSQPTTGCVAPIAAMRPAREGADQHQYQNDQQYGTQSHGFLLSIASERGLQRDVCGRCGAPLHGARGARSAWAYAGAGSVR
jgi:hypothetical protein